MTNAVPPTKLGSLGFFNFNLLLIVFTMSAFFSCDTKPAHAQDHHSTTRLTPVRAIVSFGYTQSSQWSAAIDATVTKMRYANLVVGGTVIGPYSNYISVEEPKPNITLWGISFGARFTDWYSKWKGTGISFLLGCGNADKGNRNPPWNYGGQAELRYSLFTDRKGSYAVSIGVSTRIVYVITNEDKHGVAYSSRQNQKLIKGANIALMF